ncbi:MAG: hypothetical protein AAGG75_12760 [Bacteroidota bacterium]
MNPLYLEKIRSFLQEIGIPLQFTDEPCDSFLKGIKIVNGALRVNTNDLLCTGDILHEAGHLACLPSDLRSKASGDLTEAVGADNAFEMTAILWSVAAAHHLNIPLSEIFHPHAYRGDSDWLKEQMVAGNYIGLPLLQWIRLAASDEEVRAENAPPFPALKRWLRV